MNINWRGAIPGGMLGAIVVATVAISMSGLDPTQGAELAGSQPVAGTAYIGLVKDNAVAVVDTLSGRVLSTIPVPTGPHGLVITPGGTKVYVSSDGDSTVSVMDTRTNHIAKTIDVGPTPHGLTITPDGSRVLVSGFGSNAFEVIDTASDKVIGRVPVKQPHNSAVSPDGQTAYVGSQQQGVTALVEVDAATLAPQTVIDLEQAPRALNVSPDGRRLYFTVAGMDVIQVLDTATNRLLPPIMVGASPHQPIFADDGSLAVVESQGPGELDIVNPSTNAVSGVVKIGSAPHWAALSADGRRAYGTNEISNDLSIVDLASGTVADTIPVGNGPRKIAIQPGPLAAPSAEMEMSDDHISEAHGSSLQMIDKAVGNQNFADVHGKDELELEAYDNFFEPADVRGTPGQTVTFEVSNEGRSLHNFSVTEAGIDKDIPPGGKIQVSVTFPAAGSLDYFCKFHRALGMTGRLVADASDSTTAQ